MLLSLSFIQIYQKTFTAFHLNVMCKNKMFQKTIWLVKLIFTQLPVWCSALSIIIFPILLQKYYFWTFIFVCLQFACATCAICFVVCFHRWFYHKLFLINKSCGFFCCSFRFLFVPPVVLFDEVIFVSCPVSARVSFFVCVFFIPS